MKTFTNLKLKSIAVIVFFILTINALSQSQLNTSAAKKQPTDPYKAKIHTLKNGMKLYMSVTKDAPKIQTMIAVKAGSKNDPSDATGLAHYLEHMLFKGTDKFGTKDFATESKLIMQIENLFETYRQTKDTLKRRKVYNQIDSLSGIASKFSIANEYDKMTAAIGCANTNAFTSFDHTVYINEIPSNQLENWLTLEAERFRNPVLRLFHTELEAVYEEKNRSLDNEDSKVWENIFSSLFKNHTYGTQTTIGTIEHLKNPSMKAIREYYKKNYVPNNMAIILSGDFNPEMAIKWAEAKFAYMKQTPVPKYVFSPEEKIEKPIEKNVFGPNAESVLLAFRFNGYATKDADMIKLINLILSNGKAGLIDLNLVQSQKLISAASFDYNLKDYSIHGFYGYPKENQRLEDVKDLLLSQLTEIKKGNFPDWLLKAIITDLKYQETKMLEQNYSRANEMLNAFSNDENWNNHITTIERLSKITKEQIVQFVNDNYKENYVVVYKRQGKDNETVKVEKPQITPVSVNREDQSPFLKTILNFKPSDLQPVFLNYETDFQKEVIGKNTPLHYKFNAENSTFQLYFIYRTGSNNDKVLPLAIQYLPYLGTAKFNAKELQQEFYKIGCSYSISNSEDQTYLSINGLSENFSTALNLVEQMITEPKVDKIAFDNLISDILKQREDDKKNKGIILREALFNYGLYGPINPFTYKLSKEELKSLTPDDLIAKIKSLNSTAHKAFYYGSDDFDFVKKSIEKLHPSDILNSVAQEIKFEAKESKNEVLVVDYDMTQVEILMLHKGNLYDPSITSKLMVYNEYFGGGMSGIVFQELRESKALAYSASSNYRQPSQKDKPYILSSYIGSQADKLPEAMKGMTELLDNMPIAESNFTMAKESILAGIKSERINRMQVIFNFDRAQKLGLDFDIRRKIYSEIPNITIDDLKSFQEKFIKNKPKTILVIGKKENLDLKVLENYGSVQFLSLEDIFGY